MSELAAETGRWRRQGPLFDDGFSLIPNAVLRERRLTGVAKAAWALLYDYSYRKVEPDLDDLAADLGVGVKAARKALRELEDAGSIRRIRRGLGQTNSYELLEHPPFLNGPTGLSGEAPQAQPQEQEDVLEDGEVGAKAPPSLPGPTKRPQNVVFDALVEATAANPADGGMIGKALKSIRAACQDRIGELSQKFLAENPSYDEVPAERIDAWLAAQIKQRAGDYQRLRPEWELTPTALAKHWNRIPTWKPRGGSGRLMGAAEIAGLEDR